MSDPKPTPLWQVVCVDAVLHFVEGFFSNAGQFLAEKLFDKKKDTEEKSEGTGAR